RIPPVSSFYYLCDRLWSGETGPAMRRTSKRPNKKPKDGEKLPPKHQGMVDRLYKQAEKGRRLDNRPERSLQQVLARVVVDESAKRGLLGKPDQMGAAIDGAPLETGASPYGKRICECHIRPCDCHRRIQDGNATWGWDSFHKKW